MVVEVVFQGSAEQFRAHLNRSFADPAGIMAVIGAKLVEDSRLAFTLQEFDGKRWPERYQGQEEPTINVAGALADFKTRTSPKARRFSQRPVLFDTGALSGSVSWEPVDDNTIQIGTTVPYASVHQFGGLSTQSIDEAQKDRIASWLNTPRGEPYEKHMAFLLDADELNTNVQQRQFLGITSDRREWILNTVEEWAAGELSDGGS